MGAFSEDQHRKPRRDDSHSSAFWRFKENGALVIRDFLPSKQIAVLTRRAASVFAELDQLVNSHPIERIEKLLPDGVLFRPRVSSVSLSAMQLETSALVQTVATNINRSVPDKELQTKHFLSDEAWLRRQFPSHLAPPFHRPHSWHQDGALGLNYHTMTHEGGIDTRRILTCWLALTPCGKHAPGLAVNPVSRSHIVPIHRLLQSVSPVDTPTLAAGDAILLDGGTLHKTHIAQGMTAQRLSIEFRFEKG